MGRISSTTYRIGLTGALALYLVAALLTGFIPFSPALETPLALVGWLLFAGVGIWALIRRVQFPTDDLIGLLLRPIPLALVFGVLVVITSYFTLAWQVPAVCNAISLSCFKTYQWSVQDGRFYHVTADGVSQQISRATYIREVGVHLRSAAAFGVYSLCFAWIAAAAIDKVHSKNERGGGGGI